MSKIKISNNEFVFIKTYLNKLLNFFENNRIRIENVEKKIYIKSGNRSQLVR